MVPTAEFGHWYYLIYLLPGGIALLLLLLSALGGGMHHHAHLGGGHGHHAHVAPPTVAAAHHGHTRTAPTVSKGHAPLAFFGVGRVPAPLVWGSGLLGWGLFGFWGTQLWQNSLHRPGLFVLPALATALVGAFVTQKVTVDMAARLLPQDETFATDAVELCGLTGTVAFPVDSARGRVHIYDAHGTMHDMSARTAPNAPGLERGRPALVVDYDAAGDVVIVEEAS